MRKKRNHHQNCASDFSDIYISEPSERVRYMVGQLIGDVMTFQQRSLSLDLSLSEEESLLNSFESLQVLTM